MKARVKRGLFQALGVLFSVFPVLLTILLYFPLWREEGGAKALSGFTLILILLALIPFFNTVKEALRSPSAYTLWFISFAIFFLLEKIATEMTVISFVGFIGNLCGAFFFKYARKIEVE